MSGILKVKAGDEWVDIPAIVGPQGPKGDPGDVQSVAGKTGAVTLDAGDVSFDDQQLYNDGTVGAGLAELKSQITDVETLQRVSSLNTTHFAKGTSIEAVGIPVYVDDATDYPQYGLTETGWYVFARVTAKDSITVSASTVVNGAAGYIAVVGNSYIDLAVKFGVAAMTQEVVINWGTYTDTLLFKATDLALRNMDYRTTYVEYDIGEYLTWTYALTTDTTFQRYRQYFILDNGEYTKADVIYGDPVPADTYYVHTLAHFEGMPRNITYKSEEIIDCPIEIVLPEIDDDGYGAWFELRLRYDRQCSCTLIPPGDDVHIATDNLANHTAGINVLDLHYNATGGLKTWRLISTHTGLNEYRHLVGLAFAEPPTKTVYAVGETLDLTGAKVVATLSDGSKHNVTSDNSDTRKTTFSPANGAALTASDDKVTCTFKYMTGHTVLAKTMTCTTPLTVTA